MKIAVFGTGYVGLVTGVCFAEMNHDVVCIDIDDAKVKQLSRGEPTIYEPGLDELLKRNVGKRITFTTHAKDAVERAQAIFIAVGTPQSDDGKANMEYFFHAAQTIAQFARDGQVIIDKSTVPIGTASAVEAIFSQAGKRVHVVSNPETLREGTAIRDFMSPDRIIVGARSQEAFDTLRDIYSPFLIREEASRVLEMSPESAEMVKYAANCMLAQRVSFVNFLSQLCTVMGADIRDVRRGIGSDKRIGTQFLYPGPGFGGSCFPKDISAFSYQSRAAGIEPLLLDATLQTNDSQKSFVTSMVLQALGGKQTVGVWGLAFKARTDDARGSPSITLVEGLHAAGKTVYVHDPQALDNFRKEMPQALAAEKDAILKHADVLVIMTEWDDYRTLSESELHALRGKTIVDCRNILARDVELEKLRSHGIRYIGLGIPEVDHKA